MEPLDVSLMQPSQLFFFFQRSPESYWAAAKCLMKVKPISVNVQLIGALG